MKPYQLPQAITCPACGTALGESVKTTNRRSDNDHQPRDGDPSICFACRALLVPFGSPVNGLRYPTDDEERRFLADPDVQRVIAAIGETHRRHGINR